MSAALCCNSLPSPDVIMTPIVIHSPRYFPKSKFIEQVDLQSCCLQKEDISYREKLGYCCSEAQFCSRRQTVETMLAVSNNDSKYTSFIW